MWRNRGKVIKTKLVSVQRAENVINASKNVRLSKKVKFILHRIKRHFVEIMGESAIILFVYADL